MAPSEILFSHKFFSTHFAIDYPYIDIFSSRGRKSLLNCMCCRLKMYSCGNVSSLLTCSRVNVYWALTYSRASVSCVLTHLRALRAYTSTFFVCLRAHVPTCLACSAVNMSCMCTCSRVNVPCELTSSCSGISWVPCLTSLLDRVITCQHVTCLVNTFNATSFTYTIGEFLQFN